MTGKLITAFTDATAVTSDDRFLGLDGSTTKLHRPNDIGKYVAGRLGVYNVLDYGAVGDGVTDDTAAVAACFAAAPEGATILFPMLPGDVPAVYETGQITPKNNQTIRGGARGGGIDTGGAVQIQLATNSNVSAIKVPVGVTGVVIEDIAISANPQSGGTVHGIEFEATTSPGEFIGSTVRRVFIHDMPNDGVFIGHYRRSVVIEDTTIIRCTTGVTIDTSDCKVINCPIGFHTNACVEDRSEGNRVIGCDLYNGNYGIYAPATYSPSSGGCSYIGNHLNDNISSGIHLLAGRRNIIGNEFQGNSSAVSGVGVNVHVATALSGVVITGNQFSVSPSDPDLVAYDIYLADAASKAIAYGNFHDSSGSVSGACNRPENLIGSSRSISHTSSATTVVNTVTETTVATWALPRFVKAGDLLRFDAVGDVLNNSGGNVTYTLRLKLDGTTVLSGQATVSTGANRRGLSVVGKVLVITPASSQRTDVLWTLGNGSAVHNAHFGGSNGTGTASSAVDLTAGKNLTLTIEMGTADANADLRVQSTTLALTSRQ